MLHANPRVIAAAALGVLTLAGCGGGTGSGGGGATPTPVASPTPKFNKTFAVADLASLVLQPSEGPSGVPYATSGATAAGQFWSCCPDVQAKWTTDGFVQLAGGHFQSPAAVFNKGDTWPAGPGLIFSFAAAFQDTTGAKQGLAAWYAYSAGSLTPISGLQELGPDAMGVSGNEGQIPKGSVITYIYFWRVGNVAFSVQVSGRSGTLTESDARHFADLVMAHASAH